MQFHEFELRLFVLGPPYTPVQAPRSIWIADDDGWETEFTGADLAGGVPPPYGLAPVPARLTLPCPLPRHSRLLRIRFSDPYSLGGPSVPELVIPNPYYEGPAPASAAPSLPVTKPNRFGEITLTRFERLRSVGHWVRGLQVEYTVRNRNKAGELWANLTSITDRSGQVFPLYGGGGGGGERSYKLPTAPWGDDPVWKLRFDVHRAHYFPGVDESEVFHFDHLPVPHGDWTEVNRSITRNGITLRIPAIQRSGNGRGWRFAVEG